jgi:uncharacterized protein YuzE
MKLNYDPKMNWLYIHVSEKSSVEAGGIFEGVQLEYDANRSLVGIDIEIINSPKG